MTDTAEPDPDLPAFVAERASDALIHLSPGRRWGKDHPEGEETLPEAAARELAEELGCGTGPGADTASKSGAGA
ncbi:hypothetical protein [Kitasatospora sp. LaBMicrA B282]|uniref:hypothetical protein n=1 Tax=Kitasatospora sp. LaBMicrA B282 TaxID=3420949 RepID=UPI003D114F61